MVGIYVTDPSFTSATRSKVNLLTWTNIEIISSNFRIWYGGYSDSREAVIKQDIEISKLGTEYETKVSYSRSL